MSRKTEILSRRDFAALADQLDADTADALHAELRNWFGGETCERVEVLVDSKGNIDSESSPRPYRDEEEKQEIGDSNGQR